MSELRAGVYRHYKGALYLVLGVARHSETEEQFVTYVPLGVKAGPRITVRPYKMFMEDVEIGGKKQPRFEFIGESVSEEIAKDFDPYYGGKVAK